MVKIDVWGVSEASGGVLGASWDGFRVSSSHLACFLVSFWDAFGAKIEPKGLCLTTCWRLARKVQIELSCRRELSLRGCGDVK